jgi:hypothetical protein
VLEWIDCKLPFVIGQNVIFAWGGNPGGGHGEKSILDAPTCRAIMCHSRWYENLIRSNLSTRSRAGIVRLPYSMSPQPAEPERADYDILIYDKSGGERSKLEAAIGAVYKRSVTVR